MKHVLSIGVEKSAFFHTGHIKWLYDKNVYFFAEFVKCKMCKNHFNPNIRLNGSFLIEQTLPKCDRRRRRPYKEPHETVRIQTNTCDIGKKH